MFKKINLKAGFSLVELMVVVVILGGLTALAMPRLRQFIAQGRQAEAKNLLAQIHTLQTAYQNAEDRFISWAHGSTTQIGKGGICTLSAGLGVCSDPPTPASCTGTITKADCDAISTTCIWTPTTGGPFTLGFEPQNCDDLRYGYWVYVGLGTGADIGKEGYLAVAYAPSDDEDRIYPTCNGIKGGRTTTMTHDFSTITDVASTGGDKQSVNENKVWGHDNIIEACK